MARQRSCVVSTVACRILLLSINETYDGFGPVRNDLPASGSLAASDVEPKPLGRYRSSGRVVLTSNPTEMASDVSTGQGLGCSLTDCGVVVSACEAVQLARNCSAWCEVDPGAAVKAIKVWPRSEARSIPS